MIIKSTNPLPIIHFDISESDMTFGYHCERCGNIGGGVITRRWDYPSCEVREPPGWLEGIDWCLTLVPTTSTLEVTRQGGCRCTCTAPRDIPFDAEGNVVGYYVKSVLVSELLEEPPPSYNSPSTQIKS